MAQMFIYWSKVNEYFANYEKLKSEVFPVIMALTKM